MCQDSNFVHTGIRVQFKGAQVYGSAYTVTGLGRVDSKHGEGWISTCGKLEQKRYAPSAEGYEQTPFVTGSKKSLQEGLSALQRMVATALCSTQRSLLPPIVATPERE